MPSGSSTAAVRYPANSMPGRGFDGLRKHPETDVGVDAPGSRPGQYLVVEHGQAGRVRQQVPKVEPGGPAGVSSSTAPSSTATCAARATNGLVTDASGEPVTYVAVGGQHAGGPDHLCRGGRDRPVVDRLEHVGVAHMRTDITAVPRISPRPRNSSDWSGQSLAEPHHLWLF